MPKIISCKHYISKYLKIRDKRGRIIPFTLNTAQARLYDEIKRQRENGKPVRIIILKARQMGFSTCTGGVLFYFTAMRRLVNTVIVAHTTDASSKLFNMYQTFYRYLPDEIKPVIKSSNAKELSFDTDIKSTKVGLQSNIRLYSADTEGLGRGSTITNCHLSEVAFWSDKAMQENFTGLMQAVPNEPNTIVIIESTANGYNEFQRLWQQATEGKSGFTPLFFPWFEEPSYSIPVKDRKLFVSTLSEEEKRLKRKYHLTYEQLNWRRWCIETNCQGKEDIFKQEYPSNPDEAFLMSGTPFFNSRIVKQQFDYLNSLLPEDYTQGVGEFNVETLNERVIGFQWDENPEGPLTIYSKPEQGVPYVMGADTSGGGDFNVFYVVDNRNGRMVAKFRRDKIDEHDFVLQMYATAVYYNRALIAVEINYSTYPQRKLQELGYDNFYEREVFDDYTKMTVKKFGFKTMPSNRMDILNNLQLVLKEMPKNILDLDLLHEMSVFANDKNGKPVAPVGDHDDCVMAYAITMHARGQAPTVKRGDTSRIDDSISTYNEEGNVSESFMSYVSGGIW